jgi:hypothetical protein
MFFSQQLTVEPCIYRFVLFDYFYIRVVYDLVMDLWKAK